MVRTKPVQTQDKFLVLVRHHFRTQASAVAARNVTAVEHLLRRSQRMVDGWEDAAVKDCTLTNEMRAWNERQPFLGRAAPK